MNDANELEDLMMKEQNFLAKRQTKKYKIVPKILLFYKKNNEIKSQVKDTILLERFGRSVKSERQGLKTKSLKRKLRQGCHLAHKKSKSMELHAFENLL